MDQARKWAWAAMARLPRATVILFRSDTIAAVRGADDWPPTDDRWTSRRLSAGPTAGTGSFITASRSPSSSAHTLATAHGWRPAPCHTSWWCRCSGTRAGSDALDRYVHALGGDLQIVANFGDEQIEVG